MEYSGVEHSSKISHMLTIKKLNQLQFRGKDFRDWTEGV